MGYRLLYWQPLRLSSDLSIQWCRKCRPNILGILAIVAVTEAASKHGFKALLHPLHPFAALHTMIPCAVHGHCFRFRHSWTARVRRSIPFGQQLTQISAWLSIDQPAIQRSAILCNQIGSDGVKCAHSISFFPCAEVFRESAIANAQAGYPRNESLREMAVDLITTFEPSLKPRAMAGCRSWSHAEFCGSRIIMVDHGHRLQSDI